MSSSVEIPSSIRPISDSPFGCWGQKNAPAPVCCWDRSDRINPAVPTGLAQRALSARTNIRWPLITECRLSYWQKAFRPPLDAHSAHPSIPLSHHRRISVIFAAYLLTHLLQFSLFKHICLPQSNVFDKKCRWKSPPARILVLYNGNMHIIQLLLLYDTGSAHH